MSRLAQLVERKTFNLVVVGSSPTVGGHTIFIFWSRGVGQSVASKVRSCTLPRFTLLPRRRPPFTIQSTAHDAVPVAPYADGATPSTLWPSG